MSKIFPPGFPEQLRRKIKHGGHKLVPKGLELLGDSGREELRRFCEELRDDFNRNYDLRAFGLLSPAAAMETMQAVMIDTDRKISEKFMAILSKSSGMSMRTVERKFGDIYGWGICDTLIDVDKPLD